jgi:hypothetical protein
MDLACSRSFAGKQLGSDRQDHSPINTICYHGDNDSYEDFRCLSCVCFSCVLAFPKKPFAAKVAISSKQV